MVSIPICILHSLKGLRNMEIEEEIFQKCIFNIHTLQKYGFTEKEGSYTASFSLFARHGRALTGASPGTCPGSGKCIAEQQGCLP